MEDTTHAARQLAHEIVMSRSIEERLLMCAELYEEAKEFARIGMPPGLSIEQQEIFIFQRIHGAPPVDLVTLK